MILSKCETAHNVCVIVFVTISISSVFSFWYWRNSWSMCLCDHNFPSIIAVKLKTAQLLVYWRVMYVLMIDLFTRVKAVNFYYPYGLLCNWNDKWCRFISSWIIKFVKIWIKSFLPPSQHKEIDCVVGGYFKTRSGCICWRNELLCSVFLILSFIH